MENSKCMWNTQGTIVCPKKQVQSSDKKQPYVQPYYNGIETFEPVINDKVQNPLKNLSMDLKKF